MQITTIRLAGPEPRQSWEIPVLFEDEHLLALDKPAGLASIPDSAEPALPSLLSLLHAGVAEGKTWASQRGLSYVMNAHRLDAEVSGVLLLARSKEVLVQLTNQFGSEKPLLEYVALVKAGPLEAPPEVEGAIAPHRFKPGLMQVDPHHGKKAHTSFEALERLGRYLLLKCAPVPDRPHQVRVHLRRARMPALGDRAYGGRLLMLSSLKPQYRLKGDHIERPLIQLPAVHAAAIEIKHPVSGESLRIEAPLPKDLRVAIKYLKRYTLPIDSPIASQTGPPN